MQIGMVNHYHRSLPSSAFVATLSFACLSNLSAQVPASVENLVVSEIFYDDPSGTGLEFIELRNLNATTGVALDGVVIDRGITATIGARKFLAPAGYGVVVSSVELFQLTYPEMSGAVVGTFTGKLANDGEELRILGADGLEVVRFEFDDSGDWPGRADGLGSSAELEVDAPIPVDRLERRTFLADGDNWRPSSEFGGSPGRAGLGPDNRIVINEVLANVTGSRKDQIELFNTTAQSLDVSGWLLSDQSTQYNKFTVPAGTVMAPGAFLVFDASKFAFSLSANDGDEVFLVEAKADGSLVRFVDRVEFGASREGESFGRWPDGAREMYPMQAATLGTPNNSNGNLPRIGPVVISEIHYNPDGTDLHREFIVITNTSTEEQYLSNWRLRGEVDFDFAPGTSLAPGAALAIVDFDTTTDAESLEGFRTAYPAALNLMLLGPWRDGDDLGVRLADGGGSIRLERVGPMISDAEAKGKYAYFIEDLVNYDDKSPWPLAADGQGLSLKRIDLSSLGDDGMDWAVSIPFDSNFSVPKASGGPVTIKGVNGGIEFGFERKKAAAATTVIMTTSDFLQWTPLDNFTELSVRETSTDVDFVTISHPFQSGEMKRHFRIETTRQ
ncbi:MAG: lamin tail domain-containing protein [Verrucomicrobia bacterium]|nr:lamin tail domain-containing protein [Verrucomicrobiota bacterium]